MRAGDEVSAKVNARGTGFLRLHNDRRALEERIVSVSPLGKGCLPVSSIFSVLIGSRVPRESLVRFRRPMKGGSK